MFRVSQWFISKQICPYKNKEINYFSNFFFLILLFLLLLFAF